MTKYQQYLRSNHWKETRARYIKTSYDGQTKCKMCASYGSIELHHLTYRNLGEERKRDLVGLCPDCHELVHDIMVVDGHSYPKLPGVLKQARKRWWGHASKRGLWKLRATEPKHFKVLAMNFLRDYISVRLTRLNKETRGRVKAFSNPTTDTIGT